MGDHGHVACLFFTALILLKLAGAEWNLSTLEKPVVESLLMRQYSSQSYQVSLGQWPSWTRTNAKDKAKASAKVSRLGSGGKIFLLSSLSHDDTDQWPLIPHFFRHYCDHLEIHPSQFLLILHSDAGDIAGISRMSAWLNQKYGVVFTYPVVEPYTSKGHFQIKMKILHEHVVDKDWVIQVDADEIVFFPVMPSQPLGLYELFDAMDNVGRNVYYGLMVDRISEDGSVEHVPIFPKPLHEQYSLTCAVTLLLQGSDVRKASAYRGYLRSTEGNHDVLDLNESAANLVAKPEQISILLRMLRHDLATGPVYGLLPGVVNGTLPVVKPAASLATVYHYKWIRGLTAKMRRRWITETYTQGQYGSLNDLLKSGSFSKQEVRRLCKEDLPDARAPIRALTPRELILLFLSLSPAGLDDMVRKSAPAEGLHEDVFIINFLLGQMKATIGRDDRLPHD